MFRYIKISIKKTSCMKNIVNVEVCIQENVIKYKISNIDKYFNKSQNYVMSIK